MNAKFKRENRCIRESGVRLSRNLINFQRAICHQCRHFHMTPPLALGEWAKSFICLTFRYRVRQSYTWLGGESWRITGLVLVHIYLHYKDTYATHLKERIADPLGASTNSSRFTALYLTPSLTSRHEAWRSLSICRQAIAIITKRETCSGNSRPPTLLASTSFNASVSNWNDYVKSRAIMAWHELWSGARYIYFKRRMNDACCLTTFYTAKCSVWVSW